MVSAVGKGAAKKHESINLAVTEPDGPIAPVVVLDPDALTDSDINTLLSAAEVGVAGDGLVAEHDDEDSLYDEFIAMGLDHEEALDAADQYASVEDYLNAQPDEDQAKDVYDQLVATGYPGEAALVLAYHYGTIENAEENMDFSAEVYEKALADGYDPAKAAQLGIDFLDPDLYDEWHQNNEYAAAGDAQQDLYNYLLTDYPPEAANVLAAHYQSLDSMIENMPGEFNEWIYNAALNDGHDPASAAQAGIDLNDLEEYDAWNKGHHAENPVKAPAEVEEDADAALAEAEAEMLAVLKNDPDVSALGKYDDLKGWAAEYKSIVEQATSDGATDEWQIEKMADLKDQTSGWLKGLSEAELQEIAKAQGFEYPELVGVSGKSQHPLVHWLDPAYGEHLKSKQAIQDKAIARYHDLVSGAATSYNGVTLADLNKPAPPPVVTSPAVPEWTPASIGDINDLAWTAKGGVASVASYKGFYWDPTPESLDAEVEGMLAGFTLAAAKSDDPEIQAAIDAAYQDWSSSITAISGEYYFKHNLAKILDAGHPKVVGHLDAYGIDAVDTKNFLTREEAVSVLTGVGGDPGKIAALLQNRKTAAEEWKAVRELTVEHKNKAESGAFDLSTAAGRADYFATASAYTGAHDNWNSPGNVLKDIPASFQFAPAFSPDHSDMRVWLKKVGMPDLRQTAIDGGLDADKAAGATRAQLQNYLIAHWKHKNLYGDAPESIAAGIVPKSQKQPKPKPAPKPAPSATAIPSTPSYTPTNTTATPIVAGSAAHSHKSKVLDLAAAIKAKAGAIGDLPSRVPDTTFAKVDLHPTTAPGAVGGVHSKTWWKDGQGTVFMAKPDNVMGGARTHAEAAASTIHDRLGVPTIPVYRRKLGGKECAVQPWVTGSKSLDDVPVSALTQSDVDQISRAMVSRWLMGDNDSKPDNWLRTPSGSITPVDAGQAFKYYGSDKLDPNWTWSGASFDTPMLVRIINAEKSGGLGAGVKVRPEATLPAIRAAEKMSDAEWREMVRPVAEAGAGKDGVVWNAEMTKRAAAKHGVPTHSVTKDQIVDAFLDHAVERKNGLRAGFKAYFEKAGVDASALG